MKKGLKHSTRTAADSQPLPRHLGLTPDEARELGYRDSENLVQWLNEARGTASYERVVSLRRELEALWSEFVANAEAYHHRSGREIVLGESLRDPGDWPEEKLAIQRQLHDRHVALNRTLNQYAFRPRVTYLISRQRWLFGMIPDESNDWFEIQIGLETLSEADAVLCLLRLAENGDLAKIKVCELCNQKWLFAAKRSYRFCSDKCREAFYAKSPDYHERKATNQRRYRENLKMYLSS